MQTPHRNVPSQNMNPGHGFWDVNRCTTMPPPKLFYFKTLDLLWFVFSSVSLILCVLRVFPGSSRSPVLPVSSLCTCLFPSLGRGGALAWGDLLFQSVSSIFLDWTFSMCPGVYSTSANTSSYCLSTQPSCLFSSVDSNQRNLLWTPEIYSMR